MRRTEQQLRYVIVILSLLAVMILAAGCGRSQGVAVPLDTADMPTAVPATAAPEEAAVSEAPADAAPAEAEVEQPAEAEQPAEGGSVEAAPAEVEPTITPTPWTGDWRAEPVVPEGVSQTAIDIYQRGLEMGTDPRSFSVIGDCQNIVGEPPYSFSFLGGYSQAQYYNLGSYADLQETIDYFNSTYSFSRQRIAVNPGFNVASPLTALSTDPATTPCDVRETPLECEFRVNNPSIVLISMETWWYERPAEMYADYLRQIVEFSIEHGALPILSTKADNLEGDWSLNMAVVQVAKRYDLPLWNFWAAANPLPDGGVRLAEDDPFHLTYGEVSMFQFQDPAYLQYAWNQRNLTALQTLDVVWHGVSGN
jgi:hypothetical protein